MDIRSWKRSLKTNAIQPNFQQESVTDSLVQAMICGAIINSSTVGLDYF